MRGRSKWAGVYGCFTRHPAANRALDRLYGCHLDEGLSPDQVWGYELTKD